VVTLPGTGHCEGWLSGAAAVICNRRAPQAPLHSAVRNLLSLNPGQYLLPYRSLGSAPSTFTSAA